MTPDRAQVQRLKSAMVRMLREYQATGEYTDPYGKKWKGTSTGIVLVGGAEWLQELTRSGV